MRTNRKKVFRAERGYLAAEGATKADAKAKLDTMIDWALRAAMPTVESRHGLLVMVAATAHGYCTTVIDPAKLSHGMVGGGWCQNPQGDFGEALQSARMHAAQCAWTHGCNDDAAFVAESGLGDKASELASWITFQRRYAEAKAKGATDADAHAIACGYKQAA